MTAVISLIFLIILVYGVGIYVLFNEKIRNVGFAIFILVLYSGMYNLLNLSFKNMLYIYISAIIIFWTLLEGSIREKFLIIIKGVFIISCGEEIIEAVINIVILQFLNIPMALEKKFILTNLILLIIWFMIGAMKKRKIKVQRKYLNVLIMIAMGIMAMALVMIIACIHYADPYVNSKKFSMVSNILTIISYFGIVILGLFVIYVRNSNENYKYLLETESLLRKSQKNNYEVMLAKEEETREFRHDICNHIMCLQEMIKGNNIIEANKYIDQLQIAILQIQKKNFATGNEIIDAIINYYIHQLEEDVEVSVVGLCNYDLDMNNVELCSIVSNPLQNAIEALNNQKHGRRYLKFRMNSTKHNLKMEICNSFYAEYVTMIDGLPRTIKQDKENHGIGLKNVKKLVEKNRGLFKVEIQESEFRVTLILPISK